MSKHDESVITNVPSLEEIGNLYRHAVANDWRTVQAATQQSLTRLAASRGAAAEAAELMRIAKTLVAGEPSVSIADIVE